MRKFQTSKLSQFHKAKTCWTENWWSSGIMSNFLDDTWKKNINLKHELSPSKPLLHSTQSFIFSIKPSLWRMSCKETKIIVYICKYLPWILRNDCTGGPCILWFSVPKSNHEMRGSWIPRTVFSVKPQNGSKSFLKSTFWAFFHEILIFPLLKLQHFQVYYFIQSMTCYLFWIAALATPQPKIPPHPQPRATCFFDGRNSQAQPQLYQILALIFILSSTKLVKNGFFGSKFALNC